MGAPSPSSRKAALRECLSGLRLPAGLTAAVIASNESYDARVWVIDNSSFMKTRDSHIARVAADGTIEKGDGVTRWRELQEAVSFYYRFASSCWMPTKFWLVNEPSGKAADAGKKFPLCRSTPKDVSDEIANFSFVMKNDALEYSQCRLTSRLRGLIASIEEEAAFLEANGKRVGVVICTQGTPTNSKGQSGRSIREEFRHELQRLTKLPVKVIMRLCTDDEEVIETYNGMDSSIDGVDILDDYWGEAMEIHLHNPWLTYSPGLHRLREAGLAPDLLDELDERPLTLDEVHQLCTLMFLGDDTAVNIPLPPYQPTTVDQTGRKSWLTAWTPFMRGLKHYIDKEKLQWNPMYKEMMPWINLAKLEMNLMDQLKRKDESERKKYSRSASEPYPIREESQFPQMPPNMDRRRRRKTNVNGFGERPSQKPDPKLFQSCRGIASEMPKRASKSEAKDLPEELQKWSHQSPKQLHSLQRLLITVQRTFPPMNTHVEPHEYFAKWKRIDKDAFDDVGGDAVKGLLKRATRKAKFFLHPDKLPKDMTENQSLLFKTIWNAITEKERITLG